MKGDENRKGAVRVTEGSPKETEAVEKDTVRGNMEKLKKPLIFGLMGVVFLGCMHLIFRPSEGQQEKEGIGLNDVVPQATDEGLPADKGKAYEQEMLERKKREKRNSLATLSAYWNTGEEVPVDGFPEGDESYGSRNSEKHGNPALDSYRRTQHTLSSFYEGPDNEKEELRKQLEELKEQLAEKENPKPVTVDDRFALMEKSYQMAAKYLPQSNVNSAGAAPVSGTASGAGSNQKEHFVAFMPTRKNTVSTLYREPTDSAFIAGWSKTQKRGFYTAGTSERMLQPKNSIKACVHGTQKVIGQTGVRLRLLEPAKTPDRTIPKGTVVTANAKFQGGRLQLKITSIELEGNIIPVDITVYDLDGQQGLYVPYSPELNALSEMAGNMGQSSGASLMIAQSAGQQVGADLSRGVVQGISGYFSKKVKTPKVTLKAGYQVFLVSKN